MAGWVALDQLLLGRLEEGMAEARRRGGDALRCRRGCFGCCLGPFPITEADAIRLRAGWAELNEAERDVMASRAAEVVSQLPAKEAGDWLFDREWQMLPCPALDLEAGACGLYEHRPAACRTYGPAVRLDGVDLRHCGLNYEGWSAEAIEAVRVEIRTADVAAAAVEAMGVGEGLTTVAGALAGRD